MRKRFMIATLAAMAMAAPSPMLARGNASSLAYADGHKAQKAHKAHKNEAEGGQHMAKAKRDRSSASPCPPGLARKNNGCLPPGLAKTRYSKGDRMPTTFDANNVPAAYGSRFQDTKEALFRYSGERVYKLNRDSRRVIEVITPQVQ